MSGSQISYTEAGVDGEALWCEEMSRSSHTNGSNCNNVARHPHRGEEPSSTQLTEFLTQNADLTQMGFDEEDDDGNIDDTAADMNHSPVPSSSSPQPWGRLMPCGGRSTTTSSSSHAQIIPLLPRAPRHLLNNLGSGEMTTPQLEHGIVSLGDVFNEYTIGRSRTRCDVCVQSERDVATIVATNEAAATPRKRKRQANLDWCYSLISNQHCKVYCTLDETVWNGWNRQLSSGAAAAASTATGEEDQNVVSANLTALTATKQRSALQVWIEDCSGNGTMVNGTILLRKGEKRLLHAGDEICLVYPPTLRRKISSHTEVSNIVQHFSYVFVNHCVNVMAPPPPLNSTHARVSMLPRTPSLLTKVTQRVSRPAAVDARAAVAASSSRSHGRVGDAASPGRHNGQNQLGPSSDLQQHGTSQSYSNSSSSGNNRRISPRRQPTRHIQHDYDLRDVLGRGTMGEVRRAIHRQTGQPVAVKILSLVRQRGPWNQCTEIEREAAILRQLQHPYVVQLLDVYMCPEAIYLVMELVAGGDLFDRIVDKGAYSETDARRVMRRLLSAVYYLHEGSGLNIVHRDLKPENIMLASAASDIDVKLTDFGLAKPDGDLKTFCGTPQYFAPEVLRRRHTVKGSGRYGKQADMWSLGVILYVLLTGMPPFDDDGGTSSVIDFPDSVPEAARDLVKQLLQHDPRQRATVLTACSHAWILTNDGDTHVHPLDDPRAIQHVSRDLPRPDEDPMTVAPSLRRVSSQIYSDSQTTIEGMDAAISSESPIGSEGSGSDQMESMEASENVSTVKKGPNDTVRPFEVVDGSTSDPPVLKSSNRSAKVRLSATNFSFRPQKISTATNNEIMDRKLPDPSTPLQPDDIDASDRDLSAATPNISMFEPSRLLHRSVGRAENPSPAVIATAKTLPTHNTNAITPSMSNLRRSEGMNSDDLDQAASRLNENGLEIAGDEVLSVFTENTESVSSFSTVPLDADEGLNQVLPPVPVNEAKAAPSDRKRKLTLSATTKPKKTKSTKAAQSLQGAKKTGGGKQTTLNKWFKK